LPNCFRLVALRCVVAFYFKIHSARQGLVSVERKTMHRKYGGTSPSVRPKLTSFDWTFLKGEPGETQKSMCNKKVEKQSVADLTVHSLSCFIRSACLNRKIDNSN
jgi:hypothetical protein